MLILVPTYSKWHLNFEHWSKWYWSKLGKN